MTALKLVDPGRETMHSQTPLGSRVANMPNFVIRIAWMCSFHSGFIASQPTNGSYSYLIQVVH